MEVRETNFFNNTKPIRKVWFKVVFINFAIDITNRNKMKLLLTIITLLCCAAAHADKRELFDYDWRFALGEVKNGALATLDDYKWRQLDLPHDWSIEGRFDRNAPAGNDGGYLPTGVAWYRKTFNLTDKTRGKVWLYFEGIYERSEVYVNGKHAGGHPYGYTSFYCDITELVSAGKNIVAVRVDNSKQKNCRWYSGSGIYRHVWMITADRLHIDNQGVQIATNGRNEATVETAITNETATDRNITLNTDIPGLGRAQSHVAVKAGQTVKTVQKVQLNNPKLWSTDSPTLYTARVELTDNGRIVDTQNVRFGVRSIEYSAAEGFKLNGHGMKLNGCCVHHDNGLLGAAAYDRADFRRAELIKQAGFNAVRTSHNLPSEAFLDACDRLGLLVIDEAFDGWRDAKNTHDYSTLFDKWWRDDVTAMVKRDRNHPSVFCWSVGNEVIERKKLEVVTTAHNLRLAVREHDLEKRPVTSALASWDKDWEIYDPLAAEQDIVGYNYMIHKAESDHRRVPGRVMMQTESYPRDAFANRERMDSHQYIIGDFVWTGMDYLGESGIGRYRYDTDTPGEHYERPLYPWHGSYCGDIDLIGRRKPISHYRNILNNTNERLYMAVREPDGYNGRISTGLWAVWPTWECWNWPGHEGKPIEVDVYSRCDSVRLSLNGRPIGTLPTGKSTRFMARFTLPYSAGTLKAEGIIGNKTVETQTIKTSGKPAAIRAVADRTGLTADGHDLSFIAIDIVDAAGNPVADAACDLTATLKGSAVIAAAGNANLQDTIPYFSHSFKTWKGNALVIVKTVRKAGNATLRLQSPGLKGADVRLKCRK